PNRSFAPGDEVLVKTVDGRAMIKEYSYRREGTWRFDSVNPNESPVFLEDDEIVYVHFVGAIVKSSRFIPSA
ncbi:S24 family peptidase, partial [Pseudomonas aeruginosa]